MFNRYVTKIIASSPTLTPEPLPHALPKHLQDEGSEVAYSMPQHLQLYSQPPQPSKRVTDVELGTRRGTVKQLGFLQAQRKLEKENEN